MYTCIHYLHRWQNWESITLTVTQPCYWCSNYQCCNTLCLQCIAWVRALMCQAPGKGVRYACILYIYIYIYIYNNKGEKGREYVKKSFFLKEKKKKQKKKAITGDTISKSHSLLLFFFSLFSVKCFCHSFNVTLSRNLHHTTTTRLRKQTQASCASSNQD